MGEKRSARKAKVLYAKWMVLYEEMMQANDAYCFLLDEDAKREHLVTWVSGHLDIKRKVKR